MGKIRYIKLLLALTLAISGVLGGCDPIEQGTTASTAEESKPEQQTSQTKQNIAGDNSSHGQNPPQANQELQKKVTELTNQNQQLKSQVTELTNQNQQLKSEISTLKKYNQQLVLKNTGIIALWIIVLITLLSTALIALLRYQKIIRKNKANRRINRSNEDGVRSGNLVSPQSNINLQTSGRNQDQSQNVLADINQLYEHVNALNNNQNLYQQEINGIQSRLRAIEEDSSRATQTPSWRSSSYSSSGVKSTGQNTQPSFSSPNKTRTPASSVPMYREQTLSTPQWVNTYNQNPNSLLKEATEVSETDESINNRRLGSHENVVLEKKRRGNFWILKESSYEYLVPKENLKINEYSYETVQALFECRGYQPGSNFQLIQAARVYPLTAGQKWQLEEPGILQF
ncbi:MAG: hypothetical protein F6K58_11290 [Symploca sp. SIO2E9]|nr:hypothetical protein [Symploca sp. SIO2E9]